MRLPKRGLLISFFLLAALVGAFIYERYRIFITDGPMEDSTNVIVNRGSDLDDVAKLLEGEGIITSAAVFRLGVRAFGNSRRLKAGEFRIPSKSSPKAIMNILVSGKTVIRSLTIPEGLTSETIVAMINSASGLVGGPIIDIPPNGALMPDTYHYQYGMKKAELLKKVQGDMTAYLDEVWDKRDLSLPFKTKEEALSLAAIVERETSTADERPTVASVYLNRLKRKMKLQADPTVIFAVTGGKARMDRKLTYADLRYDHPYNTYTRTGIPPGPICNPGRRSIDAVLHPEDTDYLFFVADGNGGHVFTVDYKSHVDNVGKWRKISRRQAKAANRKKNRKK